MNGAPERCPKCGSSNVIGYKGEYECMDCGYKFRLARAQLSPTPGRHEIKSRRPPSSGSRGIWITLAIILFIAGLLLGYSLNLPLASLKPAGTTVTTTVQVTGAQCVEWPETGSWASYRIDALAAFASIPGWVRIYSNGSHIIAAGFIAGNYTHKVYGVKEFEAANFFNITGVTYRGRELTLGLKPMMASVYEGSMGNLTAKIYLDEETRLPILVTLSTKPSTPLPVRISISLEDTNICQLTPGG